MLDDVHKQLTRLQKQIDNLVKPEIVPLSTYPIPCNGRLTLTSGVAVTTSDVTAATTIYFTPYDGNKLALYNGSIWPTRSFTELSLSLSGLTANTNHDVFVYDSAGTLTLEAVAWTNNSTRATDLVLQDGVKVKSGATERRYLGTFRTTGTTGQCEDSLLRRYVWNCYNRHQRRFSLTNSNSHTYDSTTIRAWNNDALFTAGLAYIIGVIEDVVFASLDASLTRVAGDSNQLVYIGTSSTVGTVTASNAVTGTLRINWIDLAIYPSLGYNELWINESGGNTGTDPTFNNARLVGWIWG